MKTGMRVIGFYVIAFLFTIMLSMVQQAAGIDAGKIILPQFGPGLAALVMLLLPGNDLTLTFVSRRASLRGYLLALGLPFLVPAVFFLGYGLTVRPLSLPHLDAASLAIMLAGMLAGAFGEELGWRGYLQKLVDRKGNGLGAFLLVGILWGLWHVGNYHYGAAYMVFFVLSTIGYSAAMAWLIRGAEYNVAQACLFHFGVNAGFFLIQDALADLRLIAWNGITWILLAAVIVIVRRKDFLPQRNEIADAKP
jgi:membrane protease YdiL (CAAX protease family)